MPRRPRWHSTPAPPHSRPARAPPPGRLPPPGRAWGLPFLLPRARFRAAPARSRRVRRAAAGRPVPGLRRPAGPAQFLHDIGVEIISTGGTMTAIREAGIPVTYVS
ncbi:hypothetical protein, partial [Allofournierella sp.]|uniref:hypothetical protein n=1 Tax=Allofournierella sp. TaxID=1940256 RepID=UPI003AB59D69